MTAIPSWLRRLRPQGRIQPPQRRGKRRPLLEQLEDRLALSTITGVVFDDINANGIQDPGDAGIVDRTVYLDANENGEFDPGEVSTDTVTDGIYSFTVADGDYRVGQVVPWGSSQTAPASINGLATGLLGDVHKNFAPPEPRTQYVTIAWADGYLYTLHNGAPGNAVLSKFEPDGDVVGSPITIPVEVGEFTYNPTTQTFWAAEWTGNRLTEFNASGTVLRQLYVNNNSDTAPINTGNVEWDGAMLRVLDNGAHSIYRVDPGDAEDGDTIQVLLDPINVPNENPWGLAFDGQHFWVDCYSSNLIYKLDADTGANLGSFASTAGPGWGMAFDGQFLWSADYGLWRIFQFNVGRTLGQDVTIDGADVSGIDFGAARLGSVSGSIYNDLNGLGSRDVGEPGLEGWRVYLDSNGNGQFDILEKTALTDASGNYTLTDVLPGSHTLAEVLRGPGWSQTAPAGTTYAITIDGSGTTVTGLDFGNALSGIGPLGPETRANVTRDETQHITGHIEGKDVSAVASDGQGKFVIVWQGNGDGDTDGIFARLYGPDGLPDSGELLVNNTTAGSQTTPMVVMAANGNFTVAWESGGSVYARRFSASGSALGNEFTVFAKTSRLTGTLDSVAMDGSGNFAILYATRNLSPNQSSMPTYYVRRFSASGATSGTAIKVVTSSLINGYASIAMSASGSFVVAWPDGTDSGNGLDVFAQRYSSTGKAVGGRITVAGVADTQKNPTIAMDASGNFVIAWEDRVPGGWAAQIFNADGTRRGDPFVYVIGNAGGNNRIPVAMDATGIVFAYRANSGIAARRYTTAGVPVGPEFQVNTSVGSERGNPSIALTGSGGFVIGWSGPGDTDESGVYFQRYAAASSLVASAAPATPHGGPALSQGELQPIVQEALARWEATGLTAAQVNLLRSVSVQVAELGGKTLGTASGNSITIDDNAGGWGWFVDPTPSNDREFRKRGDQGEKHRIDLLTAVMHEMGHVLGLEHEAHGIMRETLGKGVRKQLDDFFTSEPAQALAVKASDSRVVPFKVNGGGTAPEGLPVFPGGTASHDATGHASHLGKYTGNEGSFELLSIDFATGTGTFRGSFVFVADNGDRLKMNYGADPDNPGTFQLTPTEDGKVIVTFVAEFTPDPEESTGRFAKVTGGGFVMIATTEPFVLEVNEQGFTPPFLYTWEGEGSLEFKKNKSANTPQIARHGD